MRIEAKDYPSGTYTVFVDGVDVTDRCFAFDAEAGYAECFVRDPETKSFKLTPVREVQKTILRGVVTGTVTPKESVNA